MNLEDIIGKRLKSSVDVTMFERFPESDTVRTLPAGKPSPLISSFLPNGYFELSAGSVNLYVKESSKIEVVDTEAADDSSFFKSIWTGVTDWDRNTTTKVKKNVGFLGDGIQATKDKILKNPFSLLGDDIAKIATAGVALVVLIIIYKVWKI